MKLMPAPPACAGLSRAGTRHEAGEDRFLAGHLQESFRQVAGNAPLPSRVHGRWRRLLLAVADGGGGHGHGGAVAGIALEAALRHVLELAPGLTAPEELEEIRLHRHLEHVMHRCRDAVVAATRREPELEGAGTTLTLAYVAWPWVHVAHAGSSRACLLTPGGLVRLTADHTLAARMVEAGSLPEEAAARSPHARVTWNALGERHEFQPQVTSHRLDESVLALLLCTDGLTRCLADRRIAALLEGSEAAADACEALVSEAVSCGGKDDVTVVVAHPQAAAPAP